MKTSQFKDLIKEAVREAIKEELKDILLEAIKTPKQTIVKEIVTESVTPIKKQLDPVEARNKYMSLLEDMAIGKDTINLNTNTFQMAGPVDNENGSLPNGELPLDMIAGLMTKK